MISAEFLKMAALIDECICYILCNIADVVRLPIDMDCISEDLIQRLAAKTPVRLLMGLFDKRDKLRSRLLTAKMQQMVQVQAQKLDLSSANRLFDNIWLDGLAELISHDRPNDCSVDVFKHGKDAVLSQNGNELIEHCSHCQILHFSPDAFGPGL